MGNKLITTEGKEEILRMSFAREEAGGAFQYMALGLQDSEGATKGVTYFSEAAGNDYSRVKTETTGPTNKSITLTATFDEENFAPSTGTVIKEIALCNTDVIDKDAEHFFMFSEVPPIAKTGDISLQYTIIISID